MTEYLDVVDEDDRVIGRDTRKNVHANHQIHRGVHVFVVNSRGELLLQRRSKSRSYYPGYWDASVGGQVLSGETYERAAHRELAEELGLEGEIEAIGKYDAYSERQREKRMLFSHASDGPFNPSASEVEELAFVSVEEVGGKMAAEPFTEGFQRSFALWRGFPLV